MRARSRAAPRGPKRPSPQPQPLAAQEEEEEESPPAPPPPPRDSAAPSPEPDGQEEEEAPQPPAPEEQEGDAHACVRSRLALSGLRDRAWTAEHAAAVELFLKDGATRLLVVYVDEAAGLQVRHVMPLQEPEQLAFFIRLSEGEITAADFGRAVQFGTARRPCLDSLQRLLEALLLPRLFGGAAWPESVRGEFFAEVYHFMTSLTDTRSRLRGRTVLYVPVEALSVEPAAAAADRALVQRLEPSVIHWTRQIKEVLRAQEAVESRESAGPLEEIGFWQRRCAALCAIRRQLARRGVRRLEALLALAKSSYLAPFQKLARQIEAGSDEARSNLRFLSVLEGPLRELAGLPPAAVPARLPRLLSLARVVWVNSPHYNTRERVTALFRKMSNEIIRLCCRHVALERLFEGYVASSRRSLRDCLCCVEAWKESYLRAAQMHNRLSEKGWVLDQSSIFAQVDAFAQRCKDLLEVCDCQQHFGRWEDGQQSPPPRFFGHRGPQLAQSLVEIEETFRKHLQALRSSRGDVLDVKNPFWHDDFNRFRAGVKDLEVMTQNLMAAALETVRDAEHGVAIQDAFQPLAAREAVRRAFDKQTVRVYSLFNAELALVNKELLRKRPAPAPWGCRYSGLAHWLAALRRRLARPAERLAEARFLPQAGVGEESRQAHRLLAQALDELERKSFQEWSRALDRDCLARLDAPLLAPSPRQPGLLDVNFDKDLLKLFMEMRCWERLLFEAPHYVAEAYRRREDLRALRENLLLVVRDYNRIVSELAPEERALFAERIRSLDRKIQPGLKKLLWSHKGASSCFISECRLHAGKVQALVTEFKAATVAIARHAQRMSEVLLVRLPGQRLYADLDFAEDQQRHRARAQEALAALHAEAGRILRRAYDVFSRDGPEVQQHWFNYTVKMDKMVEEALRLNVKRSLQELAKAVTGDGKSAPSPLFRVRVLLAESEGEAPAQVAFSPSLADLAAMVNDVPGHLVLCLSAFPRLPELLGKRRLRRDPFCLLVERDEEIAKLRAQIGAGVLANASLLRGYLKTWAAYREIWEVDKDAFITRYRHLNPLVSSFDADIARYMEVANNAQKEETAVSVQFVLLDCAQLKGAVVRHCAEWQSKFTGLLQEMAGAGLRALHAYLRDNGQAIRRPPETLEELGASLRLLETLQRELPALRARVPPLHEQFAVLEKYEVAVSEEALRQLGALEGERLAFERVLRESELMLRRHEDKFRTGLVHHADDLKKKARGLLQEFAAAGPFSGGTGCAAALEQIRALRQALAAMQAEESALRSDLGVFKIDQPPSKDLQRLEKELDQLQEAWEIAQEWETRWDEWKRGSFRTLQTEPMEVAAAELARRLLRLSRELEGRRWDVVEVTAAQLDEFRRTVPLVSTLRNPAMRQRHWDEVGALLERPVQPEAEDLRLETLAELGLHRHAAAVTAVAAAATRELALELALQDLAKAWETTTLDIVPYKDKGHRQLRGTEALFGALEEHQVSLAAMKASRHARPFAPEVERWERDLSLVLEATEAALAVQRQWMHLENIFLAEDTRKQLPDEAAAFSRVDAAWKGVMERLSAEPNALRATQRPGLLEELLEMSRAMEGVRRSLDAFLEDKRLVFPRFCFLSDEELLAVLGQARAPQALQAPLPQCFEGLRGLRVHKGGPGARAEAAGMLAPDGEYVEFSRAVPLEGPVEECLREVERAMRATLRELLRGCLLALRKTLPKRDKWAREWPGQLVMAASHIQWTADVARSLAQSKERGDRRFLKAARKKQAAVLSRYAEALRGASLPAATRLRLAALVTVEAHARDVTEHLYKCGAPDAAAFEWLSQLRLYWDKDADDCVARQTCAQLPYGYEYLGNTGRLVVTPLTERSFLALTLALHLRHGGAPAGPAGAGKTETVRELGRVLGARVLVLGCAAGLDCAVLGRLCAGLAQTGAWGCFEELARLAPGPLAVAAQHLVALLAALAAGQATVALEGRAAVALRPSCGLFVTMELEGEARAELPPGLQAVLRPVAMAAPDVALVAEVVLLTEGFSDCKALARRLQTLCELAPPQLSPQPHYEAAFGLRALAPLLRRAGAARRRHPQRGDEQVLLEAAAATLEPGLAPEDLAPFRALLRDLFPGAEPPPGPHHGGDEDDDDEDGAKVAAAGAAALAAAGLQATAAAGARVRQLWATGRSGRPAVLAGPAGSGKTATWRALQSALGALARAGQPCGRLVRDFPLNPKALSPGELYGEYEPDTGRWADGVLSGLLRAACADDRPDDKWIVLDGPADTLWMEALNSALDECRVLALANGERLALPEQVSLLFEVEDLAAASPAAVSRCGVVYVDYGALGWRPYVLSWLATRPQGEAETLRPLFDKFLEPLLAFKAAACREPVPVGEHGAVASLCKLLAALATPENGVTPGAGDPALLELYFLFSLVWAVGGAVDEAGRKRLDAWLRETDASFPGKDTVYDYFVDPKKKTWASFEEQLPAAWRYSPDTPFYELLVPTADTARYQYLARALLAGPSPVLLVAPPGTGKTALAGSLLRGLDARRWARLAVSLSARTAAAGLRAALRSRVEERARGVYAPAGGRRLAAFLDDLNLPAPDGAGARPALELLRLWLERGFWHERAAPALRRVQGVALLAAMAPPGGGRSPLPPRLQARFNLINMNCPAEPQVRRIFGTLLGQKLQDFDEGVKPLGTAVTEATLELYRAVAQRFPPVPAKSHYQFSLRDVGKVFQGMLRAHKDFHDTKGSLIRLWIHECFRVFSDRLVEAGDAEAFAGLLGDKLGAFFDLPFHRVCPERRPPLFGDFLSRRRVYEDLGDGGGLRAELERVLGQEPGAPGAPPPPPLLFREAIEHVARVARVVGQPGGHVLLLGPGGSGRRSLARLGARLCRLPLATPPAGPRLLQQLRELVGAVGAGGGPAALLLAEAQLPPGALEELQGLLAAGEAPGLCAPPHWAQLEEQLRAAARAQGAGESPAELRAALARRVRRDLRALLCLSPAGQAFRTHLRQFPALLACTTLDWVGAWPHSALLEVAQKSLEGLELGPEPEGRRGVAEALAAAHAAAAARAQKALAETGRPGYVLPRSYLDLLGAYGRLLAEKREALGQAAGRLRRGLARLGETRAKAEAMSLELAQARRMVAQCHRECDDYLAVIGREKAEADEQQKAVAAISEKIGEEERQCRALAEEAQRDLAEALPALEEAMRALESLNKKDLTEIKSYGRPPALVETVLQAVMILRGSEPTWAEAKRQLGDPNFVKQLLSLERDRVPEAALRRVAAYCAQPDFQPEVVGRVARAACSLCMWVRAMETYGRVRRVVQPKQARAAAAAAQLAQKQAAQAEAQDKLREVAERLERLRAAYEEKVAQKEELGRRAQDTEGRLERAARLVEGLAGERGRWQRAVQGLEEALASVAGDCVLAAASLAYLGPFAAPDRHELLTRAWEPEVRGRGLPCAPQFSLAAFLAPPGAVRGWTLRGLPSDPFATTSGVIVTRSHWWPLMIDPQGQACRWIRDMEEARGLRVTSAEPEEALGVLEEAAPLGHPVLLQDVPEELAPALRPALEPPRPGQDGRLLLNLGEDTVECHPDFRLYLATKLPNPHFPPETVAYTTVVNFALVEQGLEAQLLAEVVREERPELEEQKEALVLAIAAGKARLAELEDQILRLLDEAAGSLLEDAQLVTALQRSKATAAEVAERLGSSQSTEVGIDRAREAYRPCAQRAALLFFALADMAELEPVYQFSLDAYVELFGLSLRRSPRGGKLEERLRALNHHHTYAVYRFACQGLFERHKLLFSFHLCTRILAAAGSLRPDEFGFFLHDGVVEDREAQMDNPCPGWLPAAAWDLVTELDKVPHFHGLSRSLELLPRDWHRWYRSARPESAPLPGEWQDSCNQLQRMLVVRALRPDRLAACVAAFVVSTLGSEFAEPPALDLQAAVAAAGPRRPVLLLLAPGAEAEGPLGRLAAAAGAPGLLRLALGPGRAPAAARLLQRGLRDGSWVLLSEGQLAPGTLGRLGALLEAAAAAHPPPAPSFRLCLCARPPPAPPLGLLHAALRLTLEPPAGLRATVGQLLEGASEGLLARSPQPGPHRRLLFALCLLHGVLRQRGRFAPLGWSRPYAFAPSDFQAAEELLALALAEGAEPGAPALAGLVAGGAYGGRLAAGPDRRLLLALAGQLLGPPAPAPGARLLEAEGYVMPGDGPLSAYRAFVGLAAGGEGPEALGLHANAAVAPRAAAAARLRAGLRALQPPGPPRAAGPPRPPREAVSGGGPPPPAPAPPPTPPPSPGRLALTRRPAQVLEMAAEALARLPQALECPGTEAALAADPSPLTAVLRQEVRRYGRLLALV
ncbi:dynein axonemal heavy chain 2, partial [Struthio camelus]|uniref:dynein axonemal heavy chain 2 n=1 Tax=Struthio camelus TaxID=8801 RepID=UPI003603E329